MASYHEFRTVTYVPNEISPQTTTTSYASYDHTHTEYVSQPVRGKYVKPVPHKMTAVTREHGFVSGYYFRGKYIISLVNSLGAPIGLAGAVSSSNMINAATVSAGDVKMSMGETLAESASTFAMVKNNARALTKFLSSLKRGDVRGAARSLGLSAKGLKNSPRDASSRYLEFMFGWMPLIEEVYNGIEALHANIGEPSDNGFITGYSEFENTRSTGTYYGIYDCTYQFTEKVNAHCKLTFKFNHPSKTRAFNQLGIMNPASLAWNLSGSSFIADWFFPVGNYLDSFGARSGLTFLDGYVTTFRVCTLTGIKGIRPKHHGGYTARIWQAPKTETTQMERFVVTSPTALPEFQLPSGLGKAITAVALLTQRAPRL